MKTLLALLALIGVSMSTSVSAADSPATTMAAAAQTFLGTLDAAQKAKEAADAARKAAAAGAIGGFITLALGGLAAWFGGGFGAPRREMSITS